MRHMRHMRHSALISDDQAIEMGRGVAAWDGFEWTPGMAWFVPHRGATVWPEHLRAGRFPIPAGMSPLPDLRDRPTQAAVLELIERAMGGSVWVTPCGIGTAPDRAVIPGWQVVSFSKVYAGRATRAEAIAAAVEGMKR